jgi:PAS domain S-box-containing protein
MTLPFDAERTNPAQLDAGRADAERTEVERLRKRLERERRARQQTEQIAEQGTHALYQKQAELQLLRSIAVAANEAESVRGVMQTTVDRICQYTGWPVGHALLLDPHQQGVLVSLGVWHLRDAQRYDAFRQVSEATSFARGIGLPGRVLTSGQPAWISDVQLDDNFPRSQLARDIGVRAGFAFPVLAGASVAAVLEFFADRPVAPDPTLLELMAHVGTQLGLVIERKQAEDHIREQAALLDKARDAILVIDLQGHVRYWNHSAERLYGFAQAEALGRIAADLLHPDASAAEQEEAGRACMATGEWSGELQQVSKNGMRLVVESRWTLLREENGRPKGTLLINTDVTVRKKLESHLLRTQRMESLGTLAGGIAHDLNNVLTPIIMGFDLLRLKLNDPVSLRFLTSMEENARRGSEMIKQVLSFARGTDGTRQPLQIGPLINEVGKLLKQTFPRSVEVRLTVPKSLWFVLGDPTQLHQVIMNLSVNARDAMPQGGRLTVTAANVVIDENYARMNPSSAPGPYVSLRFEDTGTGIPPGIVEQIFDPFFTTKEVGKGTGLGLSNALGIVEGYGGFINVYSEVGKGTCFSIYLPAHQASVQQLDVPQEQRLTGKGELILVIDDEPAIRDITQATLQGAGYRVLTAEDGAVALALYVQHRAEIRVVLTDMMMPIMDGPATIRALRKMDPALSIIAASGHAAGHSCQEWQSSVCAILSKPFTAETVLTTLHRVLNAADPSRGPTSLNERPTMGDQRATIAFTTDPVPVITSQKGPLRNLASLGGQGQPGRRQIWES